MYYRTALAIVEMPFLHFKKPAPVIFSENDEAAVVVQNSLGTICQHDSCVTAVSKYLDACRAIGDVSKIIYV